MTLGAVNKYRNLFVGREVPSNILEVEIERILPGGVGLAHAGGLTVFVSLAAPGDFVRVAINRKRGKVAFATVLEVLKPSAVRVEPPCPYFGRCGGCDFQQLTYEAQVDAKVAIVRDCMHRIAKIANPPEISIHPSPNQWQYRSRTNWQFDPQRRLLGYFEGGSHSVCDVEYCAVLVPELQQTLERLREELREGEVLSDANEIDAVAGENRISVAPPIDRFNTGEVIRKIGTESYRFDATSFFQINHQLLELLVAAAVSGVPATGSATAVDLYCGVGLFTLPLARKFERVIGVEANPTAVRFARANVQDAGLGNVEIVCSRVGDWLLGDSDHAELSRQQSARAPRTRSRVAALNGSDLTGLDSSVESRANSFSDLDSSLDFLLLDPPRSGAEPSAIEGILKLKPKQICYVSCDPATLGRDLKLLLQDYLLDSLTAFDMFPQTHHVETVSHLVLSTSR